MRCREARSAVSAARDGVAGVRLAAALFLIGVVFVGLPGGAKAQHYEAILEPSTYQPLPIPGGEPVTTYTNSQFKGWGYTPKQMDIQLPFAVGFFGKLYSQLRVLGNGTVTFDMSVTHSDSRIMRQIPGSTGYHNFIAVWWDQHVCNDGTGGPLKSQVVGTAPNRRFVIEWNHCRRYASSGEFTAQLWLTENSDEIEVHYGPITGANTWVATMGVENEDGTDGTHGLGLNGDCGTTCTTTDFPTDMRIRYSAGPAVRVESIEAPVEGFAGIAFPVRYLLTNPGSKPAENFTVQYWVSREPKLTDESISMGYAQQHWTLDPRQTVEVFAEPRLPIQLDQGEFYLLVEADPHHVVDVGNRASTIGVFGPFHVGLRAPNLKVDWVSAPSLARPGEPTGIQWRLDNTGNLEAAVIPYRVMLTQDGAWSPSLPIVAEGTIPALAAEAFLHVDTDFEVPADLEPGVYRAVVEVNPLGVIFEHERRDNTALSDEFLVSRENLVVLTKELPVAHAEGHYEVLLRAVGGDGRYAWRLAEGSVLPPGIQLIDRVSKNGREMATFLSGVPSTIGTYSFTLVVDSDGNEVDHAYELEVQRAAHELTIVTEHLADGAFGFPYDDELRAIGGVPPYSWEVIKGSLPVGMHLRSDGILSGRPEQDGAFPVTVRVRDTVGRQGTKELDLFVTPPSRLTCVTRRLEPLALGQHVQLPVHAAGGVRGDDNSYIWSSVGTTWLATEIGETTEYRQGPPPGLQVSNDGVISGIPEAFGSFVWTLNVKDRTGGSGVDCPIRVDVPRDRGLTVVTRRLPTAIAGRNYRTQLEATGGDGELTWSEYAGGRVLDDLELYFDATGSLVGTPPLSLLQGEEEREFAITVRVRDAANRIGVGVVTLTLKAPGKRETDVQVDEGGCQASGGAPLSWMASLLALAWLARRRA